MRRFAPEKWGGTESVVFNLSQEFTRRGIKSPIFCTDMFSRAGADQFNTVTIRRFRYVFPWFGLSREARSKLRLKGGSPLSLSLFFGLLKERDISVIHTHVQHRLGGIARTVAKMKGVPYVVSIHGGYFTVPADQIEKMKAPFQGKCEWGKAFGWMLGSRKVLRDAAAVICVGQNEYQEMKKQYPASSVFYVPNGVQVSRFSSSDAAAFREAYGFKPSDRIVLCVSRIDYQKNQIGLVRAFAAFAENHPDHKLVLIGAVTVEAYRDQVLAEIDALGIGARVRVIEGLRPDDPLLASAYKAADQFVLASLHEPFGIVVLEAWAAGTPVVAYEVGGIPGFTAHNENILLVGKGDEAGLASGMAALADQPELCRSLAERAFREVESTYDWSAVSNKMLEIYEQITG